MMVKALRVGPLLMMLAAGVTLSYPRTSAVAVRIIPSSLQLFTLESVNFMCEGTVGLHGWEVKSSSGNHPQCSASTATSAARCTIRFAYPSDTGEYWCEGGGHQSSSTVSITVTGGSVVLDSPVHQVRTGEAVTLHCRHKTPSFNITADFYKDGLFLLSSASEHMTIRRVSKSDQGRYKCSIRGAGESAESPLTVTGGSGDTVVDRSASHHSYYVLLWSLTVTTLVLQLLVLGLLYLKKQLVLIEAGMKDPHGGVAGKDANNLSLYFDMSHVTARDYDEVRLQSFGSSFLSGNKLHTQTGQ